MRKFLPLLCATSLLASCAPILSTATKLAEQGPAPARLGPLEVGQTWTVTGFVNAENVTLDAPITQLTGDLRQGATLSGRDELTAFQSGRAGVNVVKYDATGVATLTFSWVGRVVEGRPYVYTCTMTDLTTLPYRGTLTLERGEPTPLRGTCSTQPRS